jgi:hypothetical protein
MWGAAVVMPAAPCFFILIDFIEEFLFVGFLAHKLLHPCKARNLAKRPSPICPGVVNYHRNAAAR